MAYADFQTLVADLVRDDEANITSEQLDAAIDRAVVRYSADRPQLKVVDAAGAGGHALALPAGWQADFSEIRGIEYPIGENPPEYVERESFRLYTKPDGSQEIRFDNALPNGEQLRVSFTVRQELTSGAEGKDTIPLVDREAVAKYAAADLCDQLAALYSNSGDSTIQADAVQYQSKARERRSQAQTYRKQYFDHLGINERNAVPASASATVQLKASHGGERLFHGRNRRLH